MLRDLASLRERTDITLVRDGTYMIDYSSIQDKAAVRPFIHSLPRSTGVTECGFKHCLPEDLGLLVAAFPDAQHLELWMGGEECVNGGKLCELASSSQLLSLTLTDGKQVTPMEVLALRTPTLHTLACDTCALLTTVSLRQCARLLVDYGSTIKIRTTL
ncbi:MAG: hypothetical protein WDW38_007572 [Sanguina aurantia]